MPRKKTASHAASRGFLARGVRARPRRATRRSRSRPRADARVACHRKPERRRRTRENLNARTSHERPRGSHPGGAGGAGVDVPRGPPGDPRARRARANDGGAGRRAEDARRRDPPVRSGHAPHRPRQRLPRRGSVAVPDGRERPGRREDRDASATPRTSTPRPAIPSSRCCARRRSRP